jgi:hypothetical protein
MNELSLIPTDSEIQVLSRISQSASKSGLFKISPDAALAICLKGRELNIPPMQALSHVNIIEGKACLSAELMHALVLKACPDCSITIVETSNERCEIHAQRTKEAAVSKFIFTMKDAEQAQLLGKMNWRKYPRAMLRSRCMSEMCRSVFPDALVGASYTPEELEPTPIYKNENTIDMPVNLPQSEPAIVHQDANHPLIITTADLPLVEVKGYVWTYMQKNNIDAKFGRVILDKVVAAEINMDRKDELEKYIIEVANGIK